MQSKNFITFLIIILLSTSCTIGITSFKVKKKDLNASVYGNVHAQNSKSSGEKTQTYVPGEILVKFIEDTDLSIIQKISNKLNISIIREISKTGLYLMKINNETPVEDMIERLKEYKEVSYSEPNYKSSINSR